MFSKVSLEWFESIATLIERNLDEVSRDNYHNGSCTVWYAQPGVHITVEFAIDYNPNGEPTKIFTPGNLTECIVANPWRDNDGS